MHSEAITQGRRKMTHATTAQLYRQASFDDTYDAIVIGSGIGGLSVAALLARQAHKRVLVLERHSTPGGFTHTFRRPGFEWDVGVHYIGQVLEPANPVRKLFDYVTDGRLQWQAMSDVYDRICLADREYDFVAGRERFRARLIAYFPSQASSIDRYLKLIAEAARSNGGYFAAKALPSFLSGWLAPLLQRKFLRFSDATTAARLATITDDKELTGVLTGQWGDYGLPPAQSSFAIHSMIAEHYIDGAAYPVGGAGAIVDAIAPVLQQAGGKIVIAAEVSQVLVRDGRAYGVRMADGREILSSTIISDAGAANTYTRLLTGMAHQAAEIEALGASSAHLSLYVGLDRTDPELGMHQTNLWICPGPDHDANVARFNADHDEPFPVAFISFPSAKDPTFQQRCPGKAACEVVAPIPFSPFAQWKDTRWKRRGMDYDELKHKMKQRLLQILEERVPQVRGHVEWAELSTPLTTRHFANYEQGEIYGVAAVPARFRSKALWPTTPIRGFYLTGQDVAALGVTGALFGGALTASAILRGNVLGKI
jgi:all-trans-retinol 13,14-reductase